MTRTLLLQVGTAQTEPPARRAFENGASRLDLANPKTHPQVKVLLLLLLPLPLNLPILRGRRTLF